MTGAPWLVRVWCVVVPAALPGVIAAWLIGFIFCLRDLGASMLVYPAGQDTLPVRIFTLMANGAPSLIAALCVILVAATLVLAGHPGCVDPSDGKSSMSAIELRAVSKIYNGRTVVDAILAVGRAGRARGAGGAFRLRQDHSTSPGGRPRDTQFGRHQHRRNAGGRARAQPRRTRTAPYRHGLPGPRLVAEHDGVPAPRLCAAL